MGDRKIPYTLIQAITPLFVGRGNPPITVDELIAISEAHSVDALRRSPMAGEGTKLSVQDVSPVFPKNPNDVKPLMVRYRAERGVFMTDETIRSRSFGVGPIVEATEYKEDQACVLVGDSHAEPLYPAGTVLHIIDVKAYQPAQLKGKRCVINLASKQGLREVAVGVISDIHGNTHVIKSLDGEELDGDILGIVHRSLRRE